MNYLPPNKERLNDIDFSACELDCAWACSEKGVISAHINIFAWEEFGSALANDYTACFYGFAAV